MVRFGSLADILTSPHHVRFTPNNGRWAAHPSQHLAVGFMSTGPSLVLLTLLALGTFLAGVNFLSLEICFLGLAMALAVPAIAWFKQSALFLVLAAIFVIGLGLVLWPRLT